MTVIEASSLLSTLDGGFQLGPLSLEVGSGSRAAILGPSGCGKTTLLRCLAGLERPTQGTIRFGDRAVFDGTNCVSPSERRVGFVFQDAALWPHLTAAEHLRFVDRTLTKADAAGLLARVGLEDRRDRRPASLSGGEAQRLALARALAGKPDVLLLDEPLSSIDVPLRDELGLLIDRLCTERGLTLIVVTHDRHEALSMADDLIVMREGRVVESGAAERILREPATAYGASFVAGAACLPAVEVSSDVLETPFGRFERPAGVDGALSLVVLPGDVVVDEAALGTSARVARVVPTVDGMSATLDVAGHSLRVTCPVTTRAGESLSVRLRGEPRLLPDQAKR